MHPTIPTDDRRSARLRVNAFQATSAILKEKLSPQNAVMPMPVAGAYPSYVFAHQQAPTTPHAPFYSPVLQPPQQAAALSASTSLGYASMPSTAGAMYFASPSQLPAQNLTPNLLLPPGSPFLFAPPMTACAAENHLQHEIAMRFLASQSCASQPNTHLSLAGPGMPAPTSTPFLMATASSATGAATVPAPWSAALPPPPPPPAQPRTNALRVTSPGPAPSAPLFVVCANPSNPQMMTLFTHPAAAPSVSTSSASLCDGQSQSPSQHQPQQGPPPQYREAFTSTSCASLGPMPGTNVTLSSASASASATPATSMSSTTATTTTATATTTTTTTARAVVVEEGRSFDEEPVPIDTSKCQLIVNFLSQRVTNDEFRDLFRPYGELFEHASHIIYDFRHGKGHHAGAATNPLNGATASGASGAHNNNNNNNNNNNAAAEAALTTARSKGYGFIYYRDGLSTAGAIRELNGKDVHGRRIKVRYAGQQRSVEDILREEEKALMEASVNYFLDDDEDM